MVWQLEFKCTEQRITLAVSPSPPGGTGGSERFDHDHRFNNKNTISCLVGWFDLFVGWLVVCLLVVIFCVSLVVCLLDGCLVVCLFVCCFVFVAGFVC